MMTRTIFKDILFNIHGMGDDAEMYVETRK
jgi:hypothetical protein